MENVVHSIDLNKNVSASVGGGCIAIIDGSGPCRGGRCYGMKNQHLISKNSELTLPQTPAQ